MSGTRPWTIGIALALGSLGAPLTAQAAPGEGGPNLGALKALMNTKVITATRLSQNSSEVPATVLVITQEQIRIRGYRSLLDVFRDLPDFKVEYNGDWEWMNDFTVRGVAGHDKFVILLDGVRISGPTNEQLPILENYPVHFAKQIEVVFGPASALYGPDAVSGVINIISRHPGAAEATLGGGQDGQRLLNFLWGQPLGPHAQLTLAGQWYHDDQPLADLARDWPDYRNFGSHRTGVFHTYLGNKSPLGAYDPDPAAPIKTRAVFASLNLGDFTFFAFRNSAKIPSTSANTPDNSLFNADNFLDHGVTVLGTKHSREIGAFSLQTTLTTSQYSLDPNSRYRNVHSDFVAGYKYAQSDTFKAEQQVTWFAYGRLNFVGGVSFEKIDAVPWTIELAGPVNRADAIKGILRKTPIEADIYRLDYTNTAAYLQAQIKLSPDLTATLGTRYDYNSRYGSSFNPRVGLVWELGETGSLKVLYGTAFLAPSPYAAFASFGGLSSTDGGLTYSGQFLRLPNPGLKPIESKTYELSYQAFLGTHWALSLSAFRMDLDRQYNVDSDTGPGKTNLYPQKTYKGWPVNYIEVRINQGHQRNVGGTLKADFKTEWGRDHSLSVYAALSYVDGKTDPLDNGHQVEIDRIAPTHFRLGATWQTSGSSLTLALIQVGTQRLPAFVQGTDHRYTLPAYRTLNLNYRHRLTAHAELVASVSNLFNARYRNITAFSDPYGNSAQFTGAPQYGRRGTLGLSIRY